MVLSEEWQLLHRLDYYVSLPRAFRAESPSSFSLLLDGWRSRPSEDKISPLLEVTPGPGGLVETVIFRPEARYHLGLAYLPDGTVLVARVTDYARTSWKTYWLDKDRTPHELFNCKEGYGLGWPTVFEDGTIRLLVPLNCTTYECAAVQTAIIHLRHGSEPTLRCEWGRIGTESPLWHSTPDGRRAFGVRANVYFEMDFLDDGGVSAWSGTNFEQGTPTDHGLVPLEDGGYALLVKSSIPFEGKPRAYILGRNTEDGGVLFKEQDPLPFDKLPRWSWPGDNPVVVNGLWVYLFNRTTAGIFDPRTRSFVAEVPLVRPARENAPLPLYALASDGERVYALAEVADPDAAYTEFWARIATEFDPWLTPDGGTPPP